MKKKNPHFPSLVAPPQEAKEQAAAKKELASTTKKEAAEKAKGTQPGWGNWGYLSLEPHNDARC